MSILVTGSLAIDHIMVFEDRFENHIVPDKIHTLNVAFNVPGLRTKWGGTAGNIAYGLRKLGAEPLVLGTVGGDFGAYAQWLDQNEIAQDGVLVLPEVATAQAFIITDLGHNQIIAFHEGAMARAHEAGVERVSGDYELAIVSSNGKQAMVDLTRDLKARGARVVLDPSHGLPLFSGEELTALIDGVELYVVNDYEWSLTLKATGLTEEALVEKVGAVVITRGAEGSQICSSERTVEIPPAKAAKVVDPTGCGDAYRAGLLAGLERGRGFEIAGRMGSLMGALNVAVDGPQALEIDPEAFAARFESEFGEAL